MAVNRVHTVKTSVALPYVSNNSAVSTDPLFESGYNVMTDMRGIVGPYPGFNSSLETVASTFQNLKRTFIWKKWNGGSYIAMFCDIVGGVATVWKYEIGVDSSAVQIWTSTSAEPFDFVDANNWVYFGNGTDMRKYSGSGITTKKWGLVAPLNAPGITSVAGVLSPYSGYYWLITSYDSRTGHESSPSSLSTCSGVIAGKNFNITWAAADIDSDADTVRIYRTTDGGSTNPIQMAFVGSAAVGAGTFTDSILDAALSATTFAPATFRNDPPPPAKGFCKYASRIYMFSGDKLYYTGREEIANGVTFDCVPGGLDGNYARFDGEITAVAPRDTGVAVFLARKIWAYDGATLDTQYPYLLLDRRGVQNRTNVTSLGSTIIWFDTALQVWLDGQEISQPIRPDLQSLNPNNVSISVHLSGVYHWIVVCDSASGKLWTYDLDTGIWMVPALKNAAFVYSSNTSDEVIDLLIARNASKVLKMTPAAYLDDGASYSSAVTTNLWDMTPQQGPDWRGSVEYIGIESNATRPSTCTLLIDDDPDFGTYKQLATANQEDSFLRVTGTALKETHFMGNPDPNSYSGRRCSFGLTWADSTTGWRWYSLDVAIHPADGQ